VVVGISGTTKEFLCSRQVEADRRRGCPRVDVPAGSGHWACRIDVVASPQHVAAAIGATFAPAPASRRARLRPWPRTATQGFQVFCINDTD